MTIPTIDWTQAEPFELIQQKAQIATEQARRDQLDQARAALNQAMARFLCAGGCKDTLIAEIQAATPTPTPEPPADPEPEPTEGDTGDDGGEGATPPADDGAGTPTD